MEGRRSSANKIKPLPNWETWAKSQSHAAMPHARLKINCTETTQKDTQHWAVPAVDIAIHSAVAFGWTWGFLSIWSRSIIVSLVHESSPPHNQTTMQQILFIATTSAFPSLLTDMCVCVLGAQMAFYSHNFTQHTSYCLFHTLFL